MAITRSKQVWEPGATVKVGFLSLVVVEMVPTPGNWLPDQYVMRSVCPGKYYRFIPHNGLTRCASIEEAREAA